MRPHTGPRLRLPRGGNRCDFCGALFVSWLYACQNFRWEGRDVFLKDTGRWAACKTCGDLIDAGAWPRLVTRVMQEVRKRKDITPDELTVLRRDLRELYFLLRAQLMPGMALRVTQPHYLRTTATGN